jgi:hypothetical protein
MPVKTVQERQTFEDLVAAKRRYLPARVSSKNLSVLVTQFFREQAVSMHALIARPVTAPAHQKPIPAAGIPTRGIDSPKLKYSASAALPTYANHTASSSRKDSKATSESSRGGAAASTPRSRSQISQASSELYALAHDYCAGTASSNAKLVSNQQLQVSLNYDRLDNFSK